MKLTKFVHSCLLAETGTQNILCDPGVFSWESGLVDVDALPVLDAIVITHEHPDHFHPPFIAKLLQRFPGVSFVTTDSVAKRLHDVGAISVFTESMSGIEIFSKKRHAPLAPLDESPENIAVHIAGKLTVGGDRHDLEETKDILALTMTGPWGSARAAAEMVLRLKPKHAIPVHDWHWNNQARQIEYDRFQKILGKQGITFIQAVSGKSFEVDG